MRQDQALILSNAPIAKDVWKMVLKTPIGAEARPGQFVEITAPGYFLKRPISISEADENSLVLIYKVVGQGTKAMSGLEQDDVIDLFGPLGYGFPVEEAKGAITLIGGGVGVPPLVQTAKELKKNGHEVQVVLGFNIKEDVFGLDAFAHLGIEPVIATMDGSMGEKGTVLDAMKNRNITPETYMACGPLPMLKALQATPWKGWVSLESRMGCGIGACMGCVVLDHEGNSLRVCKNGPVFEAGKVVL